MKRRTLLASLGGAGLAWSTLAAGSNTEPSALPQGALRVVVIGGGWAGLSAARELRSSAPELEVLVIDRTPILRSLPLSNPWLVGRTPERMKRIDLAMLARALGYRFVPAEVLAIDRVQRQVHTTDGRFGYDWLILAAGVDYDYAAWFGDDARATNQAREYFPGGFVSHELDLLKRRLDGFRGGDLVMTIPPPPIRCPPAPYERAILIAWLLKTQRISGKLTVIDAGGGISRFTRLFTDRYADQIVYRPHTNLRSIDPFGRRLSTEDGEMHFDHAILLPPMRANALVEQAGLLGIDTQGKPTRWAGVDPVHLRALADDRVYLVGDLLDTVSPLFGHYPKTAHIATRLGTAAALQISALSRGNTPLQADLPQSICHVWLDADPIEQMRMEAHYRPRGDGLIVQSVRQYDNPQPRDEDLQWGQGLYAESLGVSAQ